MANAFITALNEAGYTNTGNNRNSAIRSINKLMDAGLLTFKFITRERVNAGYRFWYTGKDGKKHGTGYRFTIFGKTYNGHWMPMGTNYRNPFGEMEHESKVYDYINVEEICTRVARILEVNRTGFDSIRAGLCDCDKCEGKGFIPGFSHVFDGVCFDCGGSGIDYRSLRGYLNAQMK